MPEVCLPQSLWASKRVLVMSFVPGDNLSKLAAFKYKKGSSQYVPKLLKQRAGKRLLDVLCKAWGEMFFVVR